MTIDDQLFNRDQNNMGLFYRNESLNLLRQLLKDVFSSQFYMGIN